VRPVKSPFVVDTRSKATPQSARFDRLISHL
jgi:hypothetical protein